MKKVVSTLLLLMIFVLLSSCERKYLTIYGPTSLYNNEQITLTHNYKGKRDVKWDSLNKEIATVNDGVVTPLKEGKATITLTVGSSIANYIVEVKDICFHIEGSDLLRNGSSSTYKIIFDTTIDEKMKENLSVKWDVSDYSIGVIYKDGRLHVKNEGQLVVYATINNKTVSKTINVISFKIPYILVEGSNNVLVDENIILTLRYQNRYELDLGDIICEVDNDIILVENEENIYRITGLSKGRVNLKFYFKNYPEGYTIYTIDVIS